MLVGEGFNRSFSFLSANVCKYSHTRTQYKRTMEQRNLLQLDKCMMQCLQSQVVGMISTYTLDQLFVTINCTGINLLKQAI